MVCWTLRGCMHSILTATSGARHCLKTSLLRARHGSWRFALAQQGPYLSNHCMNEVAACWDQQVCILLCKKHTPSCSFLPEFSK